MYPILWILFVAWMTACDSSSDSGGNGGTTSSLKNTVFDLYEGDYNTGSWLNNTFSTTGDVQSSLTSIQFNADFDGMVFGVSDPDTETYEEGNVTITENTEDNTLTVTGTSDTFGNVSLTLGTDGSLSGTATNVPDEDIDSLDLSGERDSTTGTVTLNVTIHFSDNTEASSTVTLPKD